MYKYLNFVLIDYKQIEIVYFDQHDKVEDCRVMQSDP